jgi:hypothetical protein
MDEIKSIRGRSPADDKEFLCAASVRARELWRLASATGIPPMTLFQRHRYRVGEEVFETGCSGERRRRHRGGVGSTDVSTQGDTLMGAGAQAFRPPVVCRTPG